MTMNTCFCFFPIANTGPAFVQPDECKVMISYYGHKSRKDALELTSYLDHNGHRTFCSQVFDGSASLIDREINEMGVKNCEYYVILMNHDWQTSKDCQTEDMIIRERFAKGEVKVLLVWYDDFDKVLDEDEEMFYWKRWKSQQCVESREQHQKIWMSRISGYLDELEAEAPLKGYF